MIGPLRRRRPAKRYDGTIAVVSGASSGIGRRLAIDLAARGATTIGVARRAELLGEVESELRRSSPSSSTRVCDVADTAGYEKLLREIEEEHGRIDLLVNNAAGHVSTPAADGFTDAYRDVFDVNFFATVAGTLAVVPGMVRRGSGIVVNVSSDTARAPEAGEAAYAATKAATSAFSESIAHEVAAHGVSVHVLYPGWVPTAMGMAGVEDDGDMPPRPVRRTEEQISALVLDRAGGPRMEINAAALPLLAPIGRTIAPVAYQRSMRKRSSAPGRPR